MNLLVCTQAVDLDDPALGFFHQWLVELAARSTTLHVICLKEGRHDLPKNVFVHTLGKERHYSNARMTARFYHHVWSTRKEYDSVFVHMNSEYAVLGGVLWRMWGKRLVLWRNHVIYGWMTWMGAHLAHVVCYTSAKSYTAKFKHAVQMPIGIDTAFFSPGESAPQGTILFLGRLDHVKRPDVFLDALRVLEQKGVPYRVDVYGTPTQGQETWGLEMKNRFIGAPHVSVHDGVPHEETRALYRTHDIYVNLTPSGSFDKTIGEAMASGCIVVATNSAVAEVLDNRIRPSAAEPEPVAQAIATALTLGHEERQRLVERQRSFIEEKHSLKLLSERLVRILAV